MSALKRLLTGFLICSLLFGASLALDRKALIYREALGLYSTGQYGLCAAVLERYISKKNVKDPKLKLLLALSLEPLGKLPQAERLLSEAWHDLRNPQHRLICATEDAAVRAYALENPIGGTVILDLALKKPKSDRESCYLLFNSYLLKKSLNLEASLEKELFTERCRNFWLYPLVTSNTQRMQYPIPRQQQTSP